MSSFRPFEGNNQRMWSDSRTFCYSDEFADNSSPVNALHNSLLWMGAFSVVSTVFSTLMLLLKFLLSIRSFLTLCRGVLAGVGTFRDRCIDFSRGKGPQKLQIVRLGICDWLKVSFNSRLGVWLDTNQASQKGGRSTCTRNQWPPPYKSCHWE